MRKVIIALLTVGISVMLMSHNVSALNLTSDVTIKAHLDQTTITPQSWNDLDNGLCQGLSSTPTNNISCFHGGLINFTHRIPYITYVNGDIIRLSYNLSIFNESSANHSTFGGLRYIDDLNIYHLVDDVQQLNDETALIYSYFYVPQTYYFQNMYLGAQTGGFSFFLQSPSNSTNRAKLLVGDVVIFSIKGVSDYTSALTSVNSNLSAINITLNSTNSKLDDVNDNLSDVKDSVNDVNDTLQQQQEDEEEALNDATDDAQASADDSSEQAEQATSGLVSVIAGFVSAITNASASNCKIDGDLGHVDLGELDFCSINPPSYVTIIGSLVLIVIVIPFTIIMFNRFISLFRSFQG